MTDTLLSQLISRLRVVLGDGQARLFSDAQLTESLRQALNEIATQTGRVATLGGLDGAEETSLPDALQSLLVRGAAGFAARLRAVERADTFTQPAGLPADLLTWAQGELADFRSLLTEYVEQMRQNDLRASPYPPYPPSTTWQLKDEAGHV